jgi:site-specific DNA-methyltransferase (adenine-specific)
MAEAPGWRVGGGAGSEGADQGIDGKILFRDDPKGSKAEQIAIQVKGGRTGVKDVRDLRGVLDREKAARAQQAPGDHCPPLTSGGVPAGLPR